MNRPPGPGFLLFTILLAGGLWFITFRLPLLTFWTKISFSAGLLALLAARSDPGLIKNLKFDTPAALLGLASAAGLYAVFALGQTVSQALFPFAQAQIQNIYGLGHGTPNYLVGLLLLLVTGPAEEIYWRGFLQGHLVRRLGPLKGFLLTTTLYAAVHLCTLNPMLIGAAAVAGTYWGLMYLRFNNLAAQIVSHSLWSAVIFSLAPLV